MSDGRDQKVRVRTLSLKELVQRAWGKDWKKPEPAYEFTGRKFDEPNLPDIYDPNR